MGLLKHILTAFKPSNLKQGLTAGHGPHDQARTDAMVAQLSPEQRATYEANQARVAAAQGEVMAAHQQALDIEDRSRVLRGPAGRHLHGGALADVPDPAEIQRMIEAEGVWAVQARLREQQKGDFTNALKQSFGISSTPEVSDPAERARIQQQEWEARTAARAPYTAPLAPPVSLTRIATRGKTQMAEVLAHLEASGLAAHPERVWGVYRVPDRISGPLTPQSEKGRVVEWDIVHLPHGAALPPAPEGSVALTGFKATDRWVARRPSDPAPLDEDLPIAFLQWAGIGPERCLGVARLSEIRSLRWADEADDDLRPIVTGVVALHAPEASGTFDRMAAAAPLDLPHPSAFGVHVEVLAWDAVGAAVHPRIHHPPAVPSPFPYLPSTPQELILAYLEVVGVEPRDCYGVQATVDRPSPLVQGGLLTTNLGPRQPCADGEHRMRTAACEHVVIAYRDRPELAEGRERWMRYQDEVLQAHLHKAAVRGPVGSADALDGIRNPLLRGAIQVAEAIDWWQELGHEKLPPTRYCWPPVDQT